MKMMTAQKTDVGLERKDNQDDMGWFSLPAGEVFIVADGMGGEAGGREAAEMAIATIKECFETGGGAVPDLLKSSIMQANRRINEKGTSGDPQYRKMGTTVVVLAVSHNQAYMAHVGDSRIYRYRDDSLKRMTKDHSRVQQMVDDGIMSPAEAEDHPDANIITRALGAKPEVEPEVGREPCPVKPEDLFLLCTDGLCGLVEDREIADILSAGGSVESFCDNLVSAALNKGGYDNVTAQVVRFEKERAPQGDSEEKSKPIAAPVNYKAIASVVFFIVLVVILGVGFWWYLSN
jgi:PPM family protein phosphatase